LNYSGYGFAKRGAPLQLIANLIKMKGKGVKIGTVFHELYASGPYYSSAFWLSGLQKFIASSIAKLSDFILTNREQSREWLKKQNNKINIGCLSVFSNVGETDTFNIQKEKKIIIFGTSEVRQRTYQAIGEHLFDWAQKNNFLIEDIGTKISNEALRQIFIKNNHLWKEYGRLSTVEIADHLQNASYGLVSYPINYITKSGIFAAYCAFGLCPVVLDKSMGAYKTDIFLTQLPEHSTVELSLSVGKNAWEYYRHFSISKTVDYLLTQANAQSKNRN